MPNQDFHLLDEFRGHIVHSQAKEVLELGGKDQHGNAAGKTHRDWVRNVLNHRPQARYSHHKQKAAGQDGADNQVVEAVLGTDAIKDYNECAGGSSDGNFRPAQGRDEEPSDYRGENAGFRFYARSNREGHGQRQGNNSDSYSRSQVAREIFHRITFQGLDESRMEWNTSYCHKRCIQFAIIMPFGPGNHTSSWIAVTQNPFAFVNGRSLPLICALVAPSEQASVQEQETTNI